MTEVIGDIIQPSELFLPKFETQRTLSGANIASGGDIFLSGAKIWFHTGIGMEVVTSG